MKLYEIHEKIEAILSEGTDPETGEITEEAVAALDELEEALEQKALNVAAYLKGERSEAEAVEAEAKRLQERAKMHLRRADRLERYLADHLETGHEVRDARVRVTWRRTPPRVVVDRPVEEIPRLYLRHVPERWEPDKQALKRALSGERPPENVQKVAHVERETRLYVK